MRVLWQGRDPEWDELDGGAFARWLQNCDNAAQAKKEAEPSVKPQVSAQNGSIGDDGTCSPDRMLSNLDLVVLTSLYYNTVIMLTMDDQPILVCRYWWWGTASRLCQRMMVHKRTA